jgi:hypothetical protein
MDQFEPYLQYQKEITESKLKIINRFQKEVHAFKRRFNPNQKNVRQK